VTKDRCPYIECGRSSPSLTKAKLLEQVGARMTSMKNEKVKKPIEVDGLGIPVGTMKGQFNKDINSFVKEVNPYVGYDKQKQQAKD
jgi:hypothetical protein